MNNESIEFDPVPHERRERERAKAQMKADIASGKFKDGRVLDVTMVTPTEGSIRIAFTLGAKVSAPRIISN